MTARLCTRDEARALLAKWHGYDGPYVAKLSDEDDFVVCRRESEDTVVARVEGLEEHGEPLARLFASAPDDVRALALTILAQGPAAASTDAAAVAEILARSGYAAAPELAGILARLPPNDLRSLLYAVARASEKLGTEALWEAYEVFEVSEVVRDAGG